MASAEAESGAPSTDMPLSIPRLDSRRAASAPTNINRGIVTVSRHPRFPASCPIIKVGAIMSSRARSSADQSIWLRTRGSGVRISPGAPFFPGPNRRHEVLYKKNEDSSSSVYGIAKMESKRCTRCGPSRRDALERAQMFAGPASEVAPSKPPHPQIPQAR
jgi:hypothetical protein